MNTEMAIKELSVNPGGFTGDATPEAMTEIFEGSINLAVWQRNLDENLDTAVRNYLEAYRYREVRLVLTPEQVHEHLLADLPAFDGREDLVEDIALLVDMFCCLFDLDTAGLRLSVLETAMCPRFHVDRVTCRLVTSYNCVGTDWLPNETVERSKLGTGNGGFLDAESGLYQNARGIQSLQPGDVALLKGESWPDNALGGVVHRSPALQRNAKRLILTLDV